MTNKKPLSGERGCITEIGLWIILVQDEVIGSIPILQAVENDRDFIFIFQLAWD
jgi:hypothetical protein